MSLALMALSNARLGAWWRVLCPRALCWARLPQTEHAGSGRAVPERLAWGMDSLMLPSASPPPPHTHTQPTLCGARSPGRLRFTSRTWPLRQEVPGSQWGSGPPLPTFTPSGGGWESIQRKVSDSIKPKGLMPKVRASVPSGGLGATNSPAQGTCCSAPWRFTPARGGRRPVLRLSSCLSVVLGPSGANPHVVPRAS